MLKVLFLNDRTGGGITGNYLWKVMINEKVLATGTLKNHDRLSGWIGLVNYFSKALEGNAGENFTIEESDEGVQSKSVKRRKIGVKYEKK
jgi:hypothetical protein